MLAETMWWHWQVEQVGPKNFLHLFRSAGRERAEPRYFFFCFFLTPPIIVVVMLAEEEEAEARQPLLEWRWDVPFGEVHAHYR